MEPIKFDAQTGKFVPTSEQVAAVSQLIQRMLNGESQHSVLAQSIIGPIRQTAVYQAWTDDLFAHRSVAFNERPRVAISSYIAQAWHTSPDGTAMYVRPGRRYTTLDAYQIMSGMMIGWYDIEAAGWDLLSQHIGEVGEELARKKDALADTVLDAFFTANATHVVTSPGKLSKAAVDAVIKLGITNKFPVNRVVLNPATALDIGDWTVSANSMWGDLPERYGDEIVRQGWVSTYGGLTWITREWCPAGEVYFTGDPAANGQFHFEFGTSRQDTAQDIDNATTRYVWREQHGHLIAGGMSLYRVDIT